MIKIMIIVAIIIQHFMNSAVPMCMLLVLTYMNYFQTQQSPPRRIETVHSLQPVINKIHTYIACL